MNFRKLMKHNETVKTILEELSHIRVYKILYIYILSGPRTSGSRAFALISSWNRNLATRPGKMSGILKNMLLQSHRISSFVVSGSCSGVLQVAGRLISSRPFFVHNPDGSVIKLLETCPPIADPFCRVLMNGWVC